MQDLTVSNRGHSAIGTSTSESTTSAVSWAAILAGAVVAAAISLLLMVMATGLDLASTQAASATSVMAITAIALIVIQWISAASGGYITGRLRTKWVGTHTHEVFFRDTAHGFITWAVATLIVASTLASAASSLVGASVHAAVDSGVASSTAHSNAARDSVTPYDLDVLFRSAASHDAKSSPVEDARAQTGRILARGLLTGDVPGADRAYIAQLVAAQAGISEAEAQRRVDDTVAQAKTLERKARKAAEMTSILTALSMLLGAFIACVSAALGGRVRDLHP
jgi:hypothetical protein